MLFRLDRDTVLITSTAAIYGPAFVPPVAAALERMLAMRAYMRAKTVDGVIDTIAWEGYREGVDDVRYVTTLQKAIEAGVDVIVRSQTDGGGWRYQPTPDAGHDTSVTVMVFVALASARQLGEHVTAPDLAYPRHAGPCSSTSSTAATRLRPICSTSGSVAGASATSAVSSRFVMPTWWSSI